MDSKPPLEYALPCSPSFKCLDRFSIIENPEDLEDENGMIPFWPVLESLLQSPVHSSRQLADLLETIAVTLRETSEPAGDYGLLKSFIDEHLTQTFFKEVWPQLVQFALELPQHFPSGSLPVLQTDASTRPHPSVSALSLNRRQTACLVAHQFLCTLRAPSWRDECSDFSIWYGSNQRHEEACRIYLSCLFTYLERQLSEPPQSTKSQHNIIYSLHRTGPTSKALASGASEKPLAPIEIEITDRYETSPLHLGLPGGAAVVSGNRHIGFGQSATQEEIVVGSSPEACPAVLVIRGTEAVRNVVGQCREIRVVPQSTVAEEEGTDWSRRTMLFMDALEIDNLSASDTEGVLPDLVPAHIDRELIKAMTAFSSGVYEVVNAPLWGCGAFGGDPFVKVMLMWCAASAVGKHRAKLRILCDVASRGVAEDLGRLMGRVTERLGSAQQLLGLVRSIPGETERLATYGVMMALLVK
ncbi:hypothetical protein F5Y16DRAFT_410701 [Xylariaceae sp. FL0255]|nr:hypothetical protein F5Y16DRAFT_410701 [Xylariaceae sp. FL0255]